MSAAHDPRSRIWSLRLSKVRQSSRLRLIILVSIACILLVGAVVTWVLLRPNVMASFAADAIEELLGGEVTFEEAQWIGSDLLEIQGFELRAPGLPGPEGLIASIGSLVLKLDPSGLWSGDVLRDVTIDSALLRIAEDRTNQWSYNLDRLDSTAEGGGDASLPDVAITGIRLEMGTFDPSTPDSWEIVGSAGFIGMAGNDPSTDEFRFELTKLNSDEDDEFVTVIGGIDSSRDRLSLQVDGVSLTEQLRSLMPAMKVQEIWDAFDLQGSLGLIDAVFERGSSPQMSLALEDVNLILPPDLFDEDPWSHYRAGEITEVAASPRLHVNKGAIRFTGDSFHLEDLDGYLLGQEGVHDVTSVPYVINLDVESLPQMDAIGKVDDLQSILERTPFSLEISTEGFHFEEGGGADLPGEVAEIFDLFGVEVCTVDITLRFSRAESESASAPARPVTFTGEMTIDKAAGAFRRFAYPLHNLRAEIEFDDATIYLNSLVANGSGESVVMMRGEVSSVAQPSVDMHLESINLPLDAALIDAMPRGAKKMMRSLFGKHGGTTTVPPNGYVGDHELVELDLDLHREEGDGKETFLSGYINFEELKITADDFPYPIDLAAGRIHWHDSRLDLENTTGDGPVEMLTHGGGVGTIQGNIRLPEIDRKATGELDLVVRGDTINEELLEALDELAPEEVEILRNLGLEGTLDYAGKVSIVTGGGTGYDLVMMLEDGSVEPLDALASNFGLSGPVWPEDFRLENMDASMIVRRGQVLIESMSGRNELTSMELEGHIKSRPVPDLDLSLVIDRLPLSERAIESGVLFASSEQETVREIWNKWNGRGTISIEMGITGSKGESIDGSINQFWVESEDGHTARMTSGHVLFDEDHASLEDLVLEFRPPDFKTDGNWFMDFDGVLGRDDGADVMMIRADRARFGSPLLSGVVSSLMPRDSGEFWQSLEVDGWFRGLLDFDGGRDRTWRLSMTPEEVAMTHEGERLTASFDSADVEMTSGSARGSLVGRSNFGDFDIGATARMDDVFDLDIEFDFNGQLGAAQTLAILPSAVSDALQEIQWKDGQGTIITDGRLSLELHEDSDRDSVEFTGVIQTSGASMEVGVDIKEIDSILRGSYRQLDGGIPVLDVTMIASRLLASGRLVEGLEGTMAISGDGGDLLINDLRGDIADGAISLKMGMAIGSDGDPLRSLDNDWWAELLVANADLVRLFSGDEPSPQVAQEETSDPDLEEPFDASQIKGRVYMSMFLGGHFDDVFARRGRGQIQITDAVLGDVPAIMGIQQLLHLTVPTLSRPDFVDIQYYVDGEKIVLDEILIESGLGDYAVFTLLGYGTYDWQGAAIDAVLFPRGGVRLVNDIIGMVQNHLYAVGISGPVVDPEVDLVPFPGLR